MPRPNTDPPLPTTHTSVGDETHSPQRSSPVGQGLDQHQPSTVHGGQLGDNEGPSGLASEAGFGEASARVSELASGMPAPASVASVVESAEAKASPADPASGEVSVGPSAAASFDA
jgi:hypothetical protein